MKDGIHPDYHEITVLMTDGTTYNNLGGPLEYQRTGTTNLDIWANKNVVSLAGVPGAANLRLEVAGPRVRALVDGVEVLAVDDMRFAGRTGPVGLFVGDGSRGFFRELRISG